MVERELSSSLVVPFDVCTLGVSCKNVGNEQFWGEKSSSLLIRLYLRVCLVEKYV